MSAPVSRLIIPCYFPFWEQCLLINDRRAEPSGAALFLFDCASPGSLLSYFRFASSFVTNLWQQNLFDFFAKIKQISEPESPLEAVS